MERGLRASVQRIIGIGRDLALPIGHGGHIAIVVIGVGLGSEQRVFTGGGTIQKICDDARW